MTDKAVTVTDRIRGELASLPTDKLFSVVENVMSWWSRAEGGDRQAFSAVRGMIFEMNGWLGYPDERIFVENLESGDPKEVIGQYCSILLGLIGERLGDGALEIHPEAWARLGQDVCSVGGKPYHDYASELARLAADPRRGDSHVTH